MLQLLDRLGEGLGAEQCQALAEPSRRVLGRDRRRALEQDVARVHLLAHHHDRDAGRPVAGEDRRLDGRGAPMPREQRGVDVDRAVRRDVEHGARQDPAVGRDDDEVGREPPELVLERRVAHAVGLQHRHVVGDGEPLRFGGDDREPPAPGPIRLADQRDDHVRTGEQPLEARTREGGRTKENDAPGGQGCVAGDRR